MSRRTMRAARFSGPGTPVRIEEVPYPEPGPDEVVVRVAACGVCGSDLHFLEDIPLPTSPITLGHEPAGTIESIGTGVERWNAVLAVPGEDPSPQIHELTGGGVDLAVECVGSPDTIAHSVNSLDRGGTLVMVGVCMQPLRIDLPVAMLAIAEISVLGSFASHAEDLDEVLRMEAEGVIDIGSSITHRLPLDKVPEALEMLRTKRGDPERIAIEMEG
jgi:threonine dehydrogenase-like Zn-dependent dehydrogenase